MKTKQNKNKKSDDKLDKGVTSLSKDITVQHTKNCFLADTLLSCITGPNNNKNMKKLELSIRQNSVFILKMNGT
jgi:hypothetical protein